MYLQITRGERDRTISMTVIMSRTVFAFTQKEKFAADAPPQPVALATTPDIRWARRDIKTTNLLGQVMAKQAAHLAGAYEALMIAPDGDVTEAGSSSFFFIKDRELFVRPVSNDILHGITRQTMLRVAETASASGARRDLHAGPGACRGRGLHHRGVDLCSAGGRIDDTDIGDGGVGPITASLRSAYLELARAEFPKVAKKGSRLDGSHGCRSYSCRADISWSRIWTNDLSQGVVARWHHGLCFFAAR